MKKILVVLLVVTMAVTLMSCQEDVNETTNNVVNDVTNEETNEPTNEITDEETNEPIEEVEEESTEEENDDSVLVTMTLEEIVNKMYEESGLELPSTAIQPINEENMTYMLGVDNFEYLEGIASEPMMSSQAHSVVLLRVDPSSDFETIKADIKSNVDGRKWICVGVEDENILVESVGDYIILIMNDQSQVLMDTFLEMMN